MFTVFSYGFVNFRLVRAGRLAQLLSISSRGLKMAVCPALRPGLKCRREEEDGGDPSVREQRSLGTQLAGLVPVNT